MNPEIAATLIIVVALLALLASGVWIFAAMLLISGTGLYFLEGHSLVRIGTLLQSVQWRSMASFELAALPLFVWMAEILFRTKISQQMFRGLSPWVGWIPGGLLHVVILACGIFGAVCGSSAATCATVAKIAVPEMKARNYPEGITIGALAAGGSLGILIPPSIIMVLYAVSAEVSLLKLFIAGLLPGVVLMLMFSIYIVGWSTFNSERMPKENQQMPMRERFRRLAELLPITLLSAFVFGALFGGWITATESAAWGVLGSFIVAAHSRSLTWKNFVDSLMATIRTTSMLILLIAAAAMMSSFMALAGIPAAAAEAVKSLGLSPFGLIAVLMLIYIVLGMFLDGVSMILLTLPVVLPMVTQAGFDPIWFGVFLVIVIEMGALTPPVGFNLFVLQGITGRDIFTTGWMSFPFFVIMMVFVAMMTVWPAIVMSLPNLY